MADSSIFPIEQSPSPIDSNLIEPNDWSYRPQEGLLSSDTQGYGAAASPWAIRIAGPIGP